MKKEEIIKSYEKYAKENCFCLNPNQQIVNGIVDGLIKNEEKYGERYCPCRRVSGDKKEDAKNICPCIYGKEEVARQGHCVCRLFVAKQ